ncbi:hypothetical protein B0T14DRAFT_569730 [Immersiella caudata]|uniref:F-box domain-containing protein n=1 Tax=Immersiella caudata TaxID=314043 RepID=A0AA40BU45_9PEZI|nr:hypothetical protein B0T14DRAFT_569730 [Immersiella caudata]
MSLHLLELPAETLFAIFELLGCEFFAEDVGRMTVCRRWHTIVLEVLRDLHLAPPLLRLPCTGEVIARIKFVLISLDLDLDGGNELENSRIAFYTLHRLVESPSPALRRLRVHLGESWDFVPMLGAVHSLLLSAQHLTTLHINTLEFAKHWRYSHDNQRVAALRTNTRSFHLCEAINRLMRTSLRSLRCQLHLMCEQLLALPPGDSQEVLPNLKEVWVTGYSAQSPQEPEELKYKVAVDYSSQLETCRGKVIGRDFARVVMDQASSLKDRTHDPDMVIVEVY